MVAIQLSTAEADILRFVLQSYLADLHIEMACLGRQPFRQGLQEREALLGKLLQQLEEVEA